MAPPPPFHTNFSHITNAGSRVVWDDTKVLNIWIYGWALYLVWLTLSHSALRLASRRPHASNDKGWVDAYKATTWWPTMLQCTPRVLCAEQNGFDMAAIVCPFFGCLFGSVRLNLRVPVREPRLKMEMWFKLKCSSIFNAVLKLHVNFLFAVCCPDARPYRSGQRGNVYDRDRAHLYALAVFGICDWKSLFYLLAGMRERQKEHGLHMPSARIRHSENRSTSWVPANKRRGGHTKSN